MNTLTINTAICQQCGICAEVCPMGLISTGNDGFPVITDDNEARCVQCGHCEAVCTTGALKHNALPGLRMIQKEKLQEINPENLSEYFSSRRSIRKYLPKSVDKTMLEKLFETVSYSPTGINQQQNKWVVICEKSAIRRLSDAVINWMKGMVDAKADLALYLGFEKLINSYQQDDDVICREAPVLVIGYTDAAYTGGILDSVIATSHLELLLPSYGLGGCWAGFVMIALGYSPEVKQIVGLDESHAVRSALMVGYPKYDYSKLPYRKEALIKWM
ncbi:MAG TPA: nitroreductase family protein [Prolixibacteraceae bacterium]|nr:nitroreductase family protein [Prolixibacteraceae bacterium]